MVFDQAEVDIRCEWGEQGIRQLAPISDVIIIVDVMSFSTCVEIAVSRGATVFPFRWRDPIAARAFAESLGAELATSRSAPEQRASPYSLSPASLLTILTGARLVLPSPNGASLSLAASEVPVLIGCLRNCQAVARAALRLGFRIAVIPAGEKWREDRSPRFAIEDWIGAGAVIRHLKGTLSPEARMALGCYEAAANDLDGILRQCASGKELAAMGYPHDIDPIAECDVSSCAPILRDGAFAAFDEM